MANKNKKSRTFQRMSYRQVQHHNSKKREKLNKEDRQWLKNNNYKNIGWNNVINLYYKLDEILDKYRIDDLSLEELFLEADRLGNKYQTSQERQAFDRALAKEVNEIAEEIDKQFPDDTLEIIDFSKNGKNKSRNRRDRKSYRTVKI